MNAVIYARYSSHNQTEQSIEGQLAAGYQYARTKGYTVIHEYCDRAKTGTNDNREDFQQMLKDTAKHQFEVIIVWKVDRFGRNREEITFNKYKAKKNGVRVEYVAENIAEGPEGVILESVLEGMAEYYSKQLSQNVKRGLLESAKKHKIIGGHKLFGYRSSTENTYELDPETAPLAKRAFELYAEGLSMSELAVYFNNLGYHFTKNSFPRMLSNEKYKGVYTYKDVIRDQDGMPRIVSDELFDRCQERLRSNKRRPHKDWDYTDYILTDKLFCGKCGAPMVGKSGYGRHGGKYNYYVCSNQIKHCCDKKPVRRDDIEDQVIHLTLDLLKDQETFDYIVDITWNYYLEVDNEQKEIERIEKNIIQKNSAIDNLIRSVEQGMHYDLVKRRLEELEGERSALQSVMAEKRLAAGTKLTKDMIAFFLEQFRNLDYQDRNCQAKLIHTFLNTICLFDDKLRIGYNYSSNEDTVDLRNIKEGVRKEFAMPCYLQHVRTYLYHGKIVLEKRIPHGRQADARKRKELKMIR